MIAGGAHGGRVNVGLGHEAPAQEDRDLVGIDLVVLGLAAVDRLHRQGVSQNEGDAVGGAEIREPVPA